MAYTTIDKPTDYFNTVLYTGNATARSITGVGFQPDFVWNKTRSAGQNHFLYDSVRGAQKDIRSNQTGAEGTSDAVTAFNSDGFSVGSGNDGNENSQTYVNWNWKAGTSFSNDASATSVGTIDSTGSASDTAGFSVVSFTGTESNGTIKHGLSTAPSMMIVKNRNISSQWWVYHASLGATKSLNLNATDAEQDVAVIWNDTATTSSVFSVGTGNEVNGNGNSMIAYCFAEKKGYSKFGSYTGNGNADGSFVYTGFKPAFVITKRTDGTVDWYMFDNKRQNSFNVVNGMLRPSATSVELDDSSVYVDFLSNGFKWKGNNAGDNTSGGTYIFMAFAESSFVNSKGTPINAR